MPESVRIGESARYFVANQPMRYSIEIVYSLEVEHCSVITVVSCVLSTLKRGEQSFHTVMHESMGNEIRTVNHLSQYKWNTTSKRQQTSRGVSTTLWCDLHVYKGILHARPAVLLHLHQLTSTVNGQCLQLTMTQTRFKQTLHLYNDSTTR